MLVVTAVRSSQGSTKSLCAKWLCAVALPLCAAVLLLCAVALPLCAAVLPLCAAVLPLCVVALPHRSHPTRRPSGAARVFGIASYPLPR